VPTTVTITHLEQRSPADLRPKPRPRPDASFARVPAPTPELNRFFYTAIGGDWYWLERLGWTFSDWLKYLDRPDLETWVVSVAGVPAGYAELERQSGDDVEIAYFGLLPAWTGAGLGGWALTEVASRGWAMGARRVWVHTCDLDHHAALANYLARGFTPFKTETKTEDLPAISPGPWSGCGATGRLTARLRSDD
jgi:GNAT superfamily N-acetyltransferase